MNASTRSRRNGGRHLLTEGLEGSKVVYCDCQDFLKQHRENPFHICSKINDPRVSERLGPFPRPRPAANLGKELKVRMTLRYSDRLALEVSTASPRKNHTPLLKLSYFQEAMETC
ncbi:hypothetical protein ACFX14_008211 [Malus domestica]